MLSVCHHSNKHSNIDISRVQARNFKESYRFFIQQQIKRATKCHNEHEKQKQDLRKNEYLVQLHVINSTETRRHK